jgi:hypothetical protein
MILIRIIAVPILIVLYLLPTPFLFLRNLFQRICVALDWLFDRVGGLAGWDTKNWPLPKAQDESIPYTRSYYAGYEDADAKWFRRKKEDMACKIVEKKV